MAESGDGPALCVIEVGHAGGAPAAWLMNGDPERPICDHHKGQYETAWDDYSDIDWVPLAGTEATHA